MTQTALSTRDKGAYIQRQCPSALPAKCDWTPYSQEYLEYKDNAYRIELFLPLNHLSNSDSSVPVTRVVSKTLSNHLLLPLLKLPRNAYPFFLYNGNARYPQKSYHDTIRDSLDSPIELSHSSVSASWFWVVLLYSSLSTMPPPTSPILPSKISTFPKSPKPKKRWSQELAHR